MGIIRTSANTMLGLLGMSVPLPDIPDGCISEMQLAGVFEAMEFQTLFKSREKETGTS